MDYIHSLLNVLQAALGVCVSCFGPLGKGSEEMFEPAYR